MHPINLIFSLKVLLFLTPGSKTQVLPVRVRPDIKAFKISQGSSELGEIFINSTTSDNLLLLSKEMGRVELVCKADRPIKWEFIYNGKAVRNRFMSIKKFYT